MAIDLELLDVNIDMNVSSDEDTVISLSEIDDVFTMDFKSDVLTVKNEDYNELYNKPRISGTELIHDVPLVDIGVDILSNSELESLLTLE